MNSRTIEKYRDMHSMNMEVYRIMNTIGYSTGDDSIIKNNKILLTLEVIDEEKETAEWVGFV